MIKTMTFPGHQNAVANAPTEDVPYWHFVCKCGEPVQPSQSWFDGVGQVHFSCLDKKPVFFGTLSQEIDSFLKSEQK